MTRRPTSLGTPTLGLYQPRAQLRRCPAPQEIWDFAWHNVDACAQQLRRLRDNITLRYVPPGFVAPPAFVAAAWPATPRLLFTGYPYFRSGRGRCYAALQRTLGARLNATWSLWDAAAFDAWCALLTISYE